MREVCRELLHLWSVDEHSQKLAACKYEAETDCRVEENQGVIVNQKSEGLNQLFSALQTTPIFGKCETTSTFL